MKDFWEDLWENFIKPFFFVLILICGICWILTYPYLFGLGIFKWYDYVGGMMLVLDLLVNLVYQKNKTIRSLKSFTNSDGFFKTLICVITFSNLIHIKETLVIYYTVLTSKGLLLAIYFIIVGIYNYFKIPKN